MAALLPPGTTQNDFLEVVQGNPFMVNANLGIRIVGRAETWEEYIRATLQALNEQYGFTFEIPPAAPIRAASAETQSLAESVKGQISRLPE